MNAGRAGGKLHMRMYVYAHGKSGIIYIHHINQSNRCIYIYSSKLPGTPAIFSPQMSCLSLPLQAVFVGIT